MRDVDSIAASNGVFFGLSLLCVWIFIVNAHGNFTVAPLLKTVSQPVVHNLWDKGLITFVDVLTSNFALPLSLPTSAMLLLDI